MVANVISKMVNNMTSKTVADVISKFNTTVCMVRAIRKVTLVAYVLLFFKGPEFENRKCKN